MSRALSLAALLGLVASPARADTLYWLGAKLPNGPNDPMAYYVDETSPSPAGLPAADVESAIRGAYQQWQDVGCAYIGFTFAGAIADPSQLGTHTDTKNVMASFVTDPNDPRLADELGNGVAVGVALTLKTNGVIQGCDTEFNAVDWSFAVDGSPDKMDFISLANHETGHCLGLDHDPNDPTSVMYPNVQNGELRRTLDAHDIDNVCQLYPETGALGSPCSGSSCGANLSCISNPSGGTFCSHGCDPANPSSCEAGFGCQASNAIPPAAGACFPGTGSQASLIGNGCGQSADCQGAAAVCFPEANNWRGGYCSQICDDGNCPTGTVCAALPVAGAAHRYCMAPCKQGQVGCRAGYACWPFTSAGDGYCFPACQSSADCLSGSVCQCNGVCAEAGNSQANIGSPCAQNADCPTGSFCIPETLPDGISSGWPQGYCSQPCGGCLTCPLGASCVVSGAEGQSYCMAACNTQTGTGCRSGYGCYPAGHASACMPACASDADCPAGTRCASGSCLPPASVGCAACDGGSSHGGTTGGADGGSLGGGAGASPPSCGCATLGAGRGTSLPWAWLGWVALGAQRRRRSG